MRRFAGADTPGCLGDINRALWGSQHAGETSPRLRKIPTQTTAGGFNDRRRYIFYAFEPRSARVKSSAASAPPSRRAHAQLTSAASPPFPPIYCQLELPLLHIRNCGDCRLTLLPKARQPATEVMTSAGDIPFNRPSSSDVNNRCDGTAGGSSCRALRLLPSPIVEVLLNTVLLTVRGAHILCSLLTILL